MTGRSRRRAPLLSHILSDRSKILTGLLLTVVLTVVLTAGWADIGDAQGEPRPTIRIVDQTTFVPADGSLDLVLDVVAPASVASAEVDPDTDPAEGDEAASGPTLSITFYGRSETEAALEQPLSQPIDRLDPIPLDQVPRDEAGMVRLSVPVRSAASFDDQNRVLLSEPGVYPLTIELRDDGGLLATARTELVRQPIETADGPTAVPLEVAVVLNVTTAEGLSVSQATSLLAAHPAVPLTVIVDRGVVNQLRGDPDSTAALAEALAERPVLSVPTLDLDPSAMAEIGQADLYLATARADRQALLDLGLQPATGVALLDSPLTSEGIEVLGRLGIRAVLDVSDRLVGNGVIDTGLADPTRPLEVIRTDREINQVLRGGTGLSTEPGRHRANRALARLTLRRQLDDRPIVVGGPSLGVDPGPVLDAFLQSLSRAGAPQPVALDDVGGGPSLRVAERPQQDLSVVATLVEDVSRTLGAFESSYVAGGAHPDDYRQRLASALSLARNPDDRLRALGLIATQLDDELAAITVHQPQPVTLAARSAPIPLVIENASPGPRRVVLRFRGDRVVATDDGQELIVDPGVTSFDVEVEARSLGASPLEVTVWSGDESVELAQARFEIRSTAVPGLGLLISLSALALLGIWWVLDHRRRRRHRRTGAAPGPNRPTGGATKELAGTTV